MEDISEQQIVAGGLAEWSDLLKREYRLRACSDDRKIEWRSFCSADVLLETALYLNSIMVQFIWNSDGMSLDKLPNFFDEVESDENLIALHNSFVRTGHYDEIYQKGDSDEKLSSLKLLTKECGNMKILRYINKTWKRWFHRRISLSDESRLILTI